MPGPFGKSQVTRVAILSLYLREGWALFSPLNIQKYLEILPSPPDTLFVFAPFPYLS